MSFTDWLIKKYFGHEPQMTIHLAPSPRPGNLCVNLHLKQFWKKESIFKKLVSIFTKRWTLDEELINESAREILAMEVFGSTDDYGDKLFRNIIWFYKKDWNADKMTEKDLEKIEAAEAMTLMTRIRLGKDFMPLLALQLGGRSPEICGLTHMMLVKIPVISLQFFLDIDYRFTVHSIRKAQHPHADDLIAYLYDILFVQQKIAVNLHEFVLKVHAIDKLKEQSVLINANMDATLHAEQAVTYLKSSIEKTVFLLGYIFGVIKLDGIATHKKKLNKLLQAIPIKVKKNHYFELIEEFISSDNLGVLNNLRSGILHKRGIGGLQPHSHYGSDKGTDTLKEIFLTLRSEHVKNTAVLLCTLAILTDDLVERDPPDIDPGELLFETNEEYNAVITEAYYKSKNDPNDGMEGL